MYWQSIVLTLYNKNFTPKKAITYFDRFFKSQEKQSKMPYIVSINLQIIDSYIEFSFEANDHY